MTILDWHGCYREQWRGLIGDESFKHPAKFAPGLVRRIFAHGFERGYWRAGSIVGDPFGGIGGGGVIAAGMGLRWRGVELEPRFVEMARQNFAMHQAAWLACWCPLPEIVQGDSRRFAEIVGGVEGCVSSPPYEASTSGSDTEFMERDQNGAWGRRTPLQEYGSAPGQIGQLKEGSIDAVVSSPPYANSMESGDGKAHIDFSKCADGRPRTQTNGNQGTRSESYGTTPGQIGKLREGAIEGVVTSPPFEDCDTKPTKLGSGKATRADGDGAGRNKGDYVYGESNGQLGNVSGETYWQAMHQVYAQVLAALVPGGVAAIVVKDFVRDGARVPLCDRTMTLLESLGFVPIERARAWLVSSTTENGVFGDVTTTKSRKSFFRRLAEKKGSPAIDFEEVLFVRRAGA